MLRRTMTVLIIVAVALPIFASPAAAEKVKKLLVDRLLAVVGVTTISAGDVDTEKRIIKVAGDSLLYPGREGEISDKEVFKELLVRELIFQQAIKMGFDDIPDELVRKRVDKFIQALGGEQPYLDFLLKMELSDSEYSKKMESHLDWRHYASILKRFKRVEVARQFVDKKIGLQVRLTLNAQFEKDRDALAAKHPGASDEELRKILAEKMEQRGLKHWIRDVGSREEINIFEEKYLNILK